MCLISDPEKHESVHHCLLEYISILKESRKFANGYKQLIEGATMATSDDELNMSEYE